jgi:hypothetical protein
MTRYRCKCGSKVFDGTDDVGAWLASLPTGPVVLAADPKVVVFETVADSMRCTECGEPPTISTGIAPEHP